MKNNFKNFLKIFFVLTIFSPNILAQETEESESSSKEYPNISAHILSEIKYDHILSKKNTSSATPVNNGFVNIEPDISLNFNKNWSVKSAFRILPIKKRSETDSTRARTFFDSNRGFNNDDTGIVVEELKANFENDDLKINVGKFNPTFATAYRRDERVGMFVTDFAEDYELKEKIGGNITAIFDNSQLTFNAFFNDTTDLSNSAINKRGKERKSQGLAGNKRNLSSFSVTFEGDNLAAIENLSYNFGYRSQEVDGGLGRDTEKAMTANIEYLHQLPNNISLVPFAEIVKLNNFTGDQNLDALYLTTALSAEYRNWNFTIANVIREFKYDNARDENDNLFEISLGYKITQNIKVDVSRAEVKEEGVKGSLFGAMVSYVKEF